MLCIALLLVTACLSWTANSEMPASHHTKTWSGFMDDTDGRLPRTLLPYHYNVQLFPYIYAPQPPFSFSGKVAIWFRCVTATNVITINFSELTIIDSSISISVAADSPGSPPEPVLVDWVAEQSVQFLHFNLAEDLVPEAWYVISMDFTGEMDLPSGDIGFYWDSYIDVDGSTSYLAATQLQPAYARQVFPSFDEPDLKATFDVTVVYDPKFKAFSNMPIISTEDLPDGWVSSKYATTPIMSPYLLCVVVGDYVNVFGGNLKGYDVNFWTRPQLENDMQLAASMAAPIQAWLEDVFNQPFPLPKMDHITIPSKGGAMENWGLHTYNEQTVLYNPAVANTITKAGAASIISHELAHQLFGNLVTCEWWNDIWLNEGFAAYFNFYPSESLGWPSSEWQQIDRSGTLQFLDVDAKNNSDPVRKPIPTVWDAGFSFSGSTYPKGQAMIRMLKGILTRPVLERGISRYLEANKYGSVVTDDLWVSLSAQAAEDGITNPDGSPLDLKLRMDPWLNQMGFPLVGITRHAGGTATVVRIFQFLNPTHQRLETPSPWNYTWDVPLTVMTSLSPPEDWEAPAKAWIDIDQRQTTLTGLPTDLNEWVILNPRGRMFYRVLYDDDSHNAIVNALQANPRDIDGETKTQFIDDSFTLARAGYFDHALAMDTTLFLADELTYNPWFAAYKHFKSFERLSTGESWFTSYRAYVLTLSNGIYNTLGWTYLEQDTILRSFLRRDTISFSCAHGLVNCVDTALTQYYLARNDTTANVVDPNNLPTVLCTGIQAFTGNWDMWLQEYLRRKTSQIPQERYAYLFGLACTNLQSNLRSYLDALVGPDIATRDKSTAAGYLALNDYGAIILWDYLDNNWDTVTFGRFTTLGTITNGFNSQYGVDALNSFIDRHPATNENERNLYAQMVLTVQQNVYWLGINRDSLQAWFEEHSRNAIPSSAIASPLTISPIHFWTPLENYSEDVY